ncbi:DUF6009 family protein, partial [Trichocoleus desertorum AS-A10]|uniref:DUF6009 family protein n=1 Tax=Trichocoleus desertorum TaxID=1481672 RepID=UPI00329842A4
MRVVGIEAESEIVWLQDITHIDYVREETWSTAEPYCPPPKTYGQTVVGYSVLKPGIKTERGVYTRRLFTLRPHDRFYDPRGIYQKSFPMEAVDPKTVQPGIRG